MQTKIYLRLSFYRDGGLKTARTPEWRVCNGRRINRRTLAIRANGRAGWLRMEATREERFCSPAAQRRCASYEVDTMNGRCRIMMAAQHITGTTAREFLRWQFMVPIVDECESKYALDENPRSQPAGAPCRLNLSHPHRIGRGRIER
jgi:hypothetical protein